MMETNQSPTTNSSGGGHIMQSRTTSTSHGLRRRSSGRHGRRHPQFHDDASTNQSVASKPNNIHINHRNSNNFNSSNNTSQEFNTSSSTVNINEALIDENGRCHHHPSIELCRRENNVWRVLLQDCPLCSMAVDTPKIAPPPRVKKGGESSLKTDTTHPLSEEEEKSWTMSDASSEGTDNRDRKSKNNRAKAQFIAGLQTPPPPRRINKDEDRKSSGRRQRSAKSNQVASLKELGKKLAAENNNSNTLNTGENETLPTGGTPATSEDFVRSRHATMRQQQRHPPPPPRRIPSRGEKDLRSLSTKELSELRRSRQIASANQQVDEVSDLISKMSKKSATGIANVRSRSDSLIKSKAVSSNNTGTREETEAILGAAAEARARVLSLRSKRLNSEEQIPYNDNVSRTSLLERSVRMEREGSIGGAVSVHRGRSLRGGDDILGAAEEIRNRARRSLSRSRERVKAASLFCGETPIDQGDNKSEDINDGDETVATTTSKRSILNPHGLSVAPEAPVVERRSQSRGKERGYTPETNDNNHINTNTEVSSHRRPRSRNRRGSFGSQSEENITSAQTLINKRREMRERIAERQINAEKRHMKTFTDFDQIENVEVNDLADAMLHEWSDVATPRERRLSRDVRDGDRGRRGRSRSVVRDGFSKIRSASLNAFRKSSRSVNGIGDDDGKTVDSGKKSIASSMLGGLMKKKIGRSLSRSRSGLPEFDLRRHVVDDDEKSSRSSIMQRFSMSKRNTGSGRSFTSNRLSTTSKSDINYSTNSQDVWGYDHKEFSLTRLSKTSRSQGMVKSLSRNNSVGDGLNEYDSTRSDTYTLNHGAAWIGGDDLTHYFKKKGSTSINSMN